VTFQTQATSEMEKVIHHHVHRKECVSCDCLLFSLNSARVQHTASAKWLPPWNRVLLENPVKKFPTFYGTRRFITTLEHDTTWHLSSISARSIQLKSSLLISWRSTL